MSQVQYRFHSEKLGLFYIGIFSAIGGRGEPAVFFKNFQLSDVLGVDREMGFSLSTDKYNKLADDYQNHFILEDIKGEIDFGEGKSRIYAQGNDYQILDKDGEYSRLVVNEYGKGRSVYFTGLPYSPQNCRVLLRAIFYAAHQEAEMKKYYVTNVDTEVAAFENAGKVAVINNSKEPQATDLYINGEKKCSLDMKPMEMCWIEL